MRRIKGILPLLFVGALAAPAFSDQGSQGEKSAQGMMDREHRAGDEGHKGDKAAKSEQGFLVEAAMGNLAEANAGQLALDRGKMQELKDFGTTLKQDHTAANEQLKKIFEAQNLEFPKRVDKMHTKMFTKLSEARTEDFDKKFADAMVKDHEMELKKYEKWQKQVQSEDVKQYIQKTIPVLEKHLQTAKDLQKSVAQSKTSS